LFFTFKILKKTKVTQDQNVVFYKLKVRPINY